MAKGGKNTQIYHMATSCLVGSNRIGWEWRDANDNWKCGSLQKAISCHLIALMYLQQLSLFMPKFLQVANSVTCFHQQAADFLLLLLIQTMNVSCDRLSLPLLILHQVSRTNMSWLIDSRCVFRYSCGRGRVVKGNAVGI